jgi:hypothetical protein
MKLSRSLLAVVLLIGLGTAPNAFAQGLDILLTNDDGWDSVGIQALKDRP